MPSVPPNFAFRMRDLQVGRECDKFLLKYAKSGRCEFRLRLQHSCRLSRVLEVFDPSETNILRLLRSQSSLRQNDAKDLTMRMSPECIIESKQDGNELHSQHIIFPTL
jgi:hypothetical protein